MRGVGWGSALLRADSSLCPQVGSGGMDALGVLEQVFPLVRPGRLCAQPPLCPVSREPLPPPPARPRPLPAHTRSVPFNPTEPAGMRVGLVGAEGGLAGDGKGVPEVGESCYTLTTLFLADFPGRNLAGGTATNTGCASSR